MGGEGAGLPFVCCGALHPRLYKPRVVGVFSGPHLWAPRVGGGGGNLPFVCSGALHPRLCGLWVLGVLVAPIGEVPVWGLGGRIAFFEVVERSTRG